MGCSKLINSFSAAVCKIRVHCCRAWERGVPVPVPLSRRTGVECGAILHYYDGSFRLRPVRYTRMRTGIKMRAQYDNFYRIRRRITVGGGCYMISFCQARIKVREGKVRGPVYFRGPIFILEIFF